MRLPSLTAIMTLAIALGAGSVATGQASEEESRRFRAEFESLNDSGVTGSATLRLEGQTLTVKMTIAGYEPDKPHAQHIHGHNSPLLEAECPTESDDRNGDGVINFREGQSAYGTVLHALRPFSEADFFGELDYERTFELTEAKLEKLQPLDQRVIVLQGMTIDDDYIASLPVACGKIEPREE